MGKKKDVAKSIRVRVEQDLLDRIDQIAGEGGRQRFIHDAIVGKLDEELPPVMFDLVRDVDDLKARVAFLETSKSVSLQMSELNDVARNELCLTENDRKLLAYFIKNKGATTTELEQVVPLNRRSILEIINKLNERSKKLFKTHILEHQKGFVDNKRSAWWITDVDLIII